MTKLRITALLMFGLINATVLHLALAIELGPRPFELVNDMDDSPLKATLAACENKPSQPNDFSISHRGAPLKYPEHTRESYVAAAQMGAGLIECDVAFTKDKELVCRHSQCDLHKTTNILETPLAKHCSSNTKCCTSDITLAQFKTLKGKMDGPKHVEPVMASGGTLMTHKESIELFKELGVKMVPELKAPDVSMPYEGMTQQQLAQKLVDEYKAAGVAPSSVFLQSFQLKDIEYWLSKEPAFGQQAVWLDGRYRNGINPLNPRSFKPTMKALASSGLKIIAPPMWMLLSADSNGQIQASPYATEAKAAGLDIVAWTLERSGPLASGGGWYYKSVAEQINNDGDMLVVLDALNTKVGVRGVFSDWPATVTYYAGCVGR
jgi:glycerophosphoryl diester phosphodiesterase